MENKLLNALLQFSEKSPTLCLSTCSAEGQPQSSLIYFATDQEANIYFFSKQETNKCFNIDKNPKVALLAQDPAEQLTLQMEGLASKVTGRKEIRMVFDLMMKNLSQRIDWPPPAAKIEGGDLVFYKVNITWARLGHFKGHEKDIFTQLKS